MTTAELIKKLAKFPPEMPVYIGDTDLDLLNIYSINQEEIKESEWFENKFVGYKTVEIITLRG